MKWLIRLFRFDFEALQTPFLIAVVIGILALSVQYTSIGAALNLK